jgi:hypothetical protein
LRLALRDQRTGRWSEGAITDAGRARSCLGSAVGIQASGERFLVKTHLSPSASCTLVIAPDLRLVDAVPGGVLVLLPRGSFLFQRNQVHFAPTHPLEVALYDAGTRAGRTVYPARPFGPVRQRARAAARDLHADPDRLDASAASEDAAASPDGTAAAFVVHLEVRDPRDGTGRFSEEALVVLRGLDRPGRVEVAEVAFESARRRFGGQRPADFLAPRILAGLFEPHPKP